MSGRLDVLRLLPKTFHHRFFPYPPRHTFFAELRFYSISDKLVGPNSLVFTPFLQSRFWPSPFFFSLCFYLLCVVIVNSQRSPPKRWIQTLLVCPPGRRKILRPLSDSQLHFLNRSFCRVSLVVDFPSPCSGRVASDKRPEFFENVFCDPFPPLVTPVRCAYLCTVPRTSSWCSPLTALIPERSCFD